MHNHPESAAPWLLPAFIAAILAIVGAVVVIGRTGSGWADVGAMALLLVLVGLLGTMIARRLRDSDQVPRR